VPFWGGGIGGRGAGGIRWRVESLGQVFRVLYLLLCIGLALFGAWLERDGVVTLSLKKVPKRKHCVGGRNQSFNVEDLEVWLSPGYFPLESVIPSIKLSAYETVFSVVQS